MLLACSQNCTGSQVILHGYCQSLQQLAHCCCLQGLAGAAADIQAMLDQEIAHPGFKWSVGFSTLHLCFVASAMQSLPEATSVTAVSCRLSGNGSHQHVSHGMLMEAWCFRGHEDKLGNIVLSRQADSLQQLTSRLHFLAASSAAIADADSADGHRSKRLRVSFLPDKKLPLTCCFITNTYVTEVVRLVCSESVTACNSC